MTDTTMDLQALLEKTTDSDFLRQMISFTAQRLMALEVETLTGAEPGARTPDRLNPRNPPCHVWTAPWMQEKK